MDKPIDHYSLKRLSGIKSTLEANHFEVHLAESAQDAGVILLEQIIPRSGARSVSWGGSMTFVHTGLYDRVRQLPALEILDTYGKGLSPEEMLELRRKSLLVDLFITGTNALTETGKLVNLDMIGNRVAAITFGPKSVVILAGRNKIVPDIEEATFRVRNYAAPVNAMRLDKKTPCVETGFCQDCGSPERICNSWSIVEKSFPEGRIKIILINEDLGF
ncbi:MAG: lactate utilization protein [Syntrophobacteraceae bacterium]|jgi:L-lactate utilization protein LutB|nr:lactate utilization protein [Syntrophobacteraceae bacterium]